MNQCCRLLLIFYFFFFLTSFRFHYLSGVIPLALVPCGVFWGVGERRAWWNTGRGKLAGGANTGDEGQQGGASTDGEGPGEMGGTDEEGPGEGKLDRCIMHQVHTSYFNSWDKLYNINLGSALLCATSNVQPFLLLLSCSHLVFNILLLFILIFYLIKNILNIIFMVGKVEKGGNFFF